MTAHGRFHAALPTDLDNQDIAELPRWARVAFAARCARRVQAVFTAAWPEAPQEHIAAVEAAISIAEAASVGVRPSAKDVVYEAQRACEAAAVSERRAAEAAAEAAANAAESVEAITESFMTCASLGAATRAAEAIGFRGAVMTGIRRDFERLKKWAQKEAWTDETRVSREFFGPLWLEGEEPDWSKVKLVSKTGEEGEETKNIPTEEEIAQLPRWARVAFAARCARRVQPIFSAAWPDADEWHVQRIEQAISIAEDAAFQARSATIAPGIDNVKEAVVAALTSASAAVAAADAAYGAWLAATTAQTAADTVAYVAADAARAAKGASFEREVVSGIRRDFARLKEMAEREAWTDETPVLSEFFGPLWLEGEPERWPFVKARRAKFYEQPQLEIYIDPGNAPKETIQEVFEALSDLHVAAGGLGLEFVNDGNFIYAMEKVPK